MARANGLFPVVIGAAIAVLACTAERAFAQPGGPRPLPGTPGVSRPAFSPYLNLARRDVNPAINYYGIVRPQIATANALRSLQQQVAPSEQPAEHTSPTPSPLPPDVAVLPLPPTVNPAPPSAGGTDPRLVTSRPNVTSGGALAAAIGQVSTVVKPDAAVAVASAFSFPLALMAAVVAFLVGQGRVDARDPKLRSAPRTRQEMVLSFRNEEEL